MKRLLLMSVCLVLFSCKHKNSSPAKTDKDIKKDAVKLTNRCGYDNESSTLGIGLIVAPETFDIFNDSLLTNKFARINIYSAPTDTLAICPKFDKPDYGIMHFVCLDQTQKSYKVLINASQVKYMPKAKSYRFATWGDYILQSYGIRRISSSPKQALRMEPNGIDTVKIPKGQELFCPVQLKGDWLQVKYDCFYNDGDSKHEGKPCSSYIRQCSNPVTGWIKWREGNHLLIDIFLMP